MQLTKKKSRIVFHALDALTAEQVIDAATAERVRAGITVVGFDWRRLARYAFIAAIACGVISITALLADQMILAMLERIFSAPPPIKSLVMGVLSAGLLIFGLRMRRQYPERIYSNEAVFFAAVLGIAGSIFNLGKAIDTGSGHFSLLILLAALVYGFLGFALESKLIWVFSLLSLGGLVRS